MSLVEEYNRILESQGDNYLHFNTQKESTAAGQGKKSTFDEKYASGIGALPSQTQNLKARKGAAFNLLLVGQSGLGKTTFINTLFESSLLPNVWHNVEEIKPNVAFERTTRITQNKLHLVENNFNLDFTVIDTPGFCDFINNQYSYVPITEYIDQQLRLYMFQEEQPDRSKLVDNRIHACLYFINPSSKGLSAVDIEALRHISNRVNLIPVISKADTLTPGELTELKELIRQIIEAQEIKICEFIEEDDVKSSILEHIPFSLIGSESVVRRDDGSTIRGRKYDWGIAEVENENHCDFIKLREVLMVNNMIDLISTTEAYYEKCREKLINTRINKAKENLPEEDIASDFNFEDPDKNGLANYKVLAKFNKAFVDDLVIEWNPIFLQRQLAQRKKFNDVVTFEEKKFKDWKKALFSKQSTFNDEIDQYHRLIKSLNEEIILLKTPPKKESAEEVDGQEQILENQKSDADASHTAVAHNADAGTALAPTEA